MPDIHDLGASMVLPWGKTTSNGSYGRKVNPSASPSPPGVSRGVSSRRRTPEPGRPKNAGDGWALASRRLIDLHQRNARRTTCARNLSRVRARRKHAFIGEIRREQARLRRLWPRYHITFHSLWEWLDSKPICGGRVFTLGYGNDHGSSCDFPWRWWTLLGSTVSL